MVHLPRDPTRRHFSSLTFQNWSFTFLLVSSGQRGRESLMACVLWLWMHAALYSKALNRNKQKRFHFVDRLQVQFSSVQLLSRVRLFVTPWTAACQASLSITNSWSLFKLMSIKLVMPTNHLILCRPLFLLPSIFPSIRVFTSESVLHIRWPK